MDLDIELRNYLAAAEEHFLSVEAGNHRRANAAYDRAENAFRNLSAAGSQGRELLLAALTHPSMRVRSWVASHLLMYSS